MRILAIYPGLNRAVNDVAQLVIYLRRTGLELAVATSKASKSRGVHSSLQHEKMDGIDIYRPYENFRQMALLPQIHFDRLLAWARHFGPDIIFCSQELNMRIAIMLKRQLNVPIVLLVEFASDLAQGMSYGRFLPILLQLFGVPRGTAYWTWLSKWSEAIITCYPRDRPVLKQLSVAGTPVFHVPWCNQLPEEYHPASTRLQGRAIYAGTFSKFKNTEEFLHTIPALMEKTPTKEFILVGGGQTKIIRMLRNRYGRRIRHFVGLPRVKILELLSTCHYAYTPVRRGGWGFIGDCWATKTPLVMTHNDYCAQNGRDAIVTNATDIDAGVNTIYSDRSLYESLQKSGYEHYLKEHSAKSVGEWLIDILKYAYGKSRYTSTC